MRQSMMINGLDVTNCRGWTHSWLVIPATGDVAIFAPVGMVNDLKCSYLTALTDVDVRVFGEPVAGYGRHYDQVFEQVGEEIGELNHLKKRHILALAGWKRLRLNTPWTLDLNNMDDDELATRSARIFEEHLSTEERVERATSSGIPGFGGSFAVASTVLSAWRPSEFGVTDRRSRESLIRLGCTCDRKLNSYLCYLGHLRHIAHEASEAALGHPRVTPRHVDKVLFSLVS